MHVNFYDTISQVLADPSRNASMINLSDPTNCQFLDETFDTVDCEIEVNF